MKNPPKSKKKVLDERKGKDKVINESKGRGKKLEGKGENNVKGSSNSQANERGENKVIPVPVEKSDKDNVFELLSKAEGYLRGNPLLFGRYYFGKYFRLGTPRFHVKILRESMGARFLVVQAPRGSAKSTILSFLRVVHGICYKMFRFIVIVQNTKEKAQSTLDGIKKEFVDNERVVGDFGVEMPKSAANDTVFRHRDGFETRVLCIGIEQIGGIRGQRFGAWRPDLIIGDDMEDDELVKSADRRRELKFLYDDALIPAGEFGKTRVFIIGTILHHDSLMARLLSEEEYKEYRKLFFVALYRGRGGEEKSLWPEKWSVEDLKEMRAEKPSTFAKEMQGNPTSGIMRRFDRENFRYWKRSGDGYICYDGSNEVMSRGKFSECRAAISCDLAWEEKRQSDYSVILPAFLTMDNLLLLDDYVCEKGLRPNQIEEILFNMEVRLRALTGSLVVIGFEKAKLEKVVRWFLKQAMKRRNHFLSIRDIPWTGDKIERIITRLEPRYNTHTIFHKRGMGLLEQQLVQFPEGVHDDLPDAESGVSYLLTLPKKKKKAVVEDTAFEKLRKFAIESKQSPRKSFVFGKRDRRFPFPVETTILD